MEQTVSLLNESSEKLQKVSTTLSTDGSDGVQMLEKILAEDPQTIGAFLAAPVSLNETKIYPIENYGTAMAPFIPHWQPGWGLLLWQPCSKSMSLNR